MSHLQRRVGEAAEAYLERLENIEAKELAEEERTALPKLVHAVREEIRQQQRLDELKGKR